MSKENKGRTAAMTVALAALLLGTVVTGCISEANAKPKLTQTGSSTVLPLAIAWAEDFNDADISVSGGGSSHGFEALLKKECDLGDASRVLKGSDYTAQGGQASWVNADGTANHEINGVMPTQWTVAYDVLAIVVNDQNTWAPSLNYSQLHKIFTDDSPAVYWDGVPGLTGAPHEKIEIYAPDEASGTYTYFFESIVPNFGTNKTTVHSRLASGDGVYHPSADDNVILSAVKDNKNAIGYFGFAYINENPGVVKTVSIAKTTETPVEPSLQHVHTYPMARPLFIYTNGVPATGSVINKYLRYVFSDKGQDVVPVVGYVRLSLVDQTLITTQLAKLGA
jgi:phosphate transport system substrate-binding protein